MKSVRFYHGTSRETAAKGILRNGIQPGAIKQGRGHLAPVAGKVYVTPSIEYATIYALGGVMQGTSHFEDPIQLKKEGRYGYVFVIDGNDLTDADPDEDSVGEWFASQIGSAQYDENTKPWRFLGYPCKLSNNLIRDFSIKMYPRSSSIEDRTFCFIWNAMTEKQRRGSVDHYIQYQAAGGKRALKTMPDEMKQWLMAHGAHVAHSGPIQPVECWRIDKTRANILKKDCSNFFDVAEPITRSTTQINEKMVERGEYNICYKPTKTEWIRYFSENGAAGVVMRDGSVVIGDGPALDHLTIMQKASLDYHDEIYRIQIYNGNIHVELWDELGLDEWGGEYPEINAETIEKMTKYPKAQRKRAADTVRMATRGFVPGLPIIVELKSGIGGDDWLSEKY